MKFRPCIDLHNGVVKQIVGSSLKDGAGNSPETNFVSEISADQYSLMYKKDGLTGGHIIQLGKGNENAAESALSAWPGGMQLGGGVNLHNARSWIDKGADAVIVTSYVFHDGVIDEKRLESLCSEVGKKRLVLDLSCRKKGDDYYVVTDRWQKFTKEKIDYSILNYLSGYCFEYLIHAVDVEGKSGGIEEDLVKLLGNWAGIPITYAGGISNISDIEKISHYGKNAIDFTVGSALDIFGGTKLKYRELAEKFS